MFSRHSHVQTKKRGHLQIFRIVLPEIISKIESIYICILFRQHSTYTMQWYDFFSDFYDRALEKLYEESRKSAIQNLDLQDGQTVLDLACGTGANFRHLMSTQKKFNLYGTDFSQGMLHKAQQQIQKENWSNIHIFQSDARNLNQEFLKQNNYPQSFDRIICFLGFSVIPDWDKVMDQMLNLLSENGRIVIADVYAERRTIHSWLVEKIAKADLDRKIWQSLQSKTRNFNIEYMPVQENKVGGKLFIATGLKL
jgi:ubiquinone/menaquinone biosynthesis C-methylase UbiE